MKQIFTQLLAAGVLFTSTAFAQWKKIEGNGNVVTQSRTVTGFDEIGAAGGINVEVSPAAAISVKVQADDNLQEYVETIVKNERLIVKFKDHISVKSGKVKVIVAMPHLNGASIAGSGSVTSTQLIPSNGTFSSAIAGSGNIIIKTSATKVKASISGSGNIELVGKASSLDVSIAGSGNFKGYELAANDAKVHISGSGNVETSVSGALDAHISGSGSVFYKGDSQVSLHTSGSGKIKKMG